jgi:hypothetical protein
MMSGGGSRSSRIEDILCAYRGRQSFCAAKSQGLAIAGSKVKLAVDAEPFPVGNAQISIQR